MTKGYMRFFFLWARVLFSITTKYYSNSSITCLVKIFSQVEWVLMKGTFIHFAMADHEISKFICSSTHSKKNKTKENLVLILLYIKAMF